MRYAVFALALMAPSLSLACAEVRDIADDLAPLIAQARAAPSEAGGRAASSKMWELWLAAPDAAAQAVLDEGMRKRESYDYAGAIESFSELIAYCPDYAEGYNQRAFIHFLSERFEAALVDLDAALRLSPDHVGAQSGRALTLMNLGQTDAARTQLLAALDNNPWLSERFLLADGAPLGPVGEEL